MAFVYRFIDSVNNTIYVGYTGQTLEKRIYQHLDKGHLDKKCYSEIARIEYKKYKTKADAQLMEVFYINHFKPKYNKLNKQADTMNINLEDNQDWKAYKQFKPTKPLKVQNTGWWRLGAIVYIIAIILYYLLK